MLACNLTANGKFAAPQGYPFRLTVGQDIAQAFVPKGIVSIVATVKPDFKADIHLAIYTAPSSSGGVDGAPVQQIDSMAATAANPATLELTIPTNVATAEYVVRLWFDNAIGGSTDTVARDTSVTDVTTQPKLPFGVSVTDFSIT